MDPLEYVGFMKRQNFGFDDPDPGEPGNPIDGEIIARYAIVAGLVGLLVLWMVVGYIHARSRAQHGLPPLFYHRLFYPGHGHRNDGSPYRPTQPTQAYGGYNHTQAHASHQHGEAYELRDSYVNPPPVYSAEKPPTYIAPSGAPKGQEQGTVTVHPVGSSDEGPSGTNAQPHGPSQ